MTNSVLFSRIFTLIAVCLCIFIKNTQLAFFTVALALLAFFLFNFKSFSKKEIRVFCVVFMTAAMFYNFSTNALTKNNDRYSTFQADSESLVTGMIDAKNAGIKDLGVYGLGRYAPEENVIKFYKSCYGLQGKFFSFFYKFTKNHEFCCLLLAIVLALIVYFISIKYNNLLAFCFFITFLLSPWIVNFARNLYWVEFTWFVPMLLGIIISMNYKNKKVVIPCFAGIFVSVFIKSLCGYEYLSAILLAMIAVPVIDFFESIFNRDFKNAFFIFKTIFIMGCLAVLGFIIALLLHAGIKGNGNIIAGLKKIYEGDFLRRMFGGNPEDFAPNYKASLEASVRTVICKYYTFTTEIIAGIPGSWFTLLSIMPIFFFIFRSLYNKAILQDVLLYFVFYITCISWFIIGKSHSYVHTHMNYVMWYFGFIQVCFYIFIKQLKELICSGLNLISKNFIADNHEDKE